MPDTVTTPDRVATGAVCAAEGCGVVFAQAHGQPTLCRTCWLAWPPRERFRFVRASQGEA